MHFRLICVPGPLVVAARALSSLTAQRTVAGLETSWVRPPTSLTDGWIAVEEMIEGMGLPEEAKINMVRPERFELPT